MSKKALIVLLAVASAVLMSIPYLVPHCGFIALFALVPLLCSERMAELSRMKHYFWVHYLCFVLWNAFTTFWVCNATIGGGIFAVLANALQMSAIFGLFRLSKKRFKGALPYVFLAAAWLAWERYYLTWADISWPWLVFGNAFAKSIGTIQWYEYTGTLGGSLWVWLTNLGIFGTLVSLADGSLFRWNWKAKTVASVCAATILIGPLIWSAVLWNKTEESNDPLEVFITQPNIDPYHKFESLSQKQQNEILIGQIEEGLADRKADSLAQPLLILAPETFTNDVFLINGGIQSSSLNLFNSVLADYPNTNLLFGASAYRYIQSAIKPSQTARKAGDGVWVESHNSALMTSRNALKPQVFHKSKLVVGVEMTPYPALFCKIDDMLGGVIGRCIGQDEVSVLKVLNEDGSSIPVGSVVCYESIYGEYCTEYVRKGAQALCIITNDAWWGDTPGYRQHLSYASLRAIETRRDIARCANTGTSAFIDQKGRILEKTKYWTKDTLRGKVNLNRKTTFFVEHGDVIGRASIFLFLLLLLGLIVRLITKR